MKPNDSMRSADLDLVVGFALLEYLCDSEQVRSSRRVMNFCAMPTKAHFNLQLELRGA